MQNKADVENIFVFHHNSLSLKPKLDLKFRSLGNAHTCNMLTEQREHFPVIHRNEQKLRGKEILKKRPIFLYRAYTFLYIFYE